MARIIDISAQLTEERPKLQLSEDKVYEIDDRKNTVLKFEQKTKSQSLEDLGFIDEVVETFLGKKAAKEIDSMDLSIAVYRSIATAIMAAITQEDFEVAKKNFRKEGSL